MRANKWDARIRRAHELAAKHSFAAEGLRFYERLAGFQKSLFASLEAAPAKVPDTPPAGALCGELELPVLLPWFASFLSLIAEIAPLPLAQAAAALEAKGAMRWQQVLVEFWRVKADGEGGDLAAAEALLAWSFLQPYAEHLAGRADQPPVHGTPRLCPLCSGRPQVGVLRPEGHGGKRSLVCALCAHEWDFRRLVCAACGEEDVHKLPVYSAAELAHVRVEACDTCRHYINTIDLTKDGRAVPVVDELAAIPLSLWAAENRYTKLRTNLLGI